MAIDGSVYSLPLLVDLKKEDNKRFPRIIVIFSAKLIGALLPH